LGQSNKKGIINLSWAKFPAACCDKSELNRKNMIRHGLPRGDFIYFGNKKNGGRANSENSISVFKKDMGYANVDQSARYRLTLKVFEIGNKIGSILEMRSIARHYMRKLANLHKETVNLGNLDGSDVVTIILVRKRQDGSDVKG